MNKTITVRYFAGFREHAGVGEETVSVPAATAGDVYELLKDRHGSEEPLGHCKVAINEEMVDRNTEVVDGDTVLLFPPVAGG